MATPAIAVLDATPAPGTASPLPPPATFDILPPLHQLLSRLLAQSSTLPIPPADGQEAVPSISTSVPTDPNALGYKELQPLEIQHLAQEASRIKIRVQKARQAVKALPDIDRPVEDQEDEIADLEDRCEELKKVLRDMAARAQDAEEVTAQNGTNGTEVQMTG